MANKEFLLVPTAADVSSLTEAVDFNLVGEKLGSDLENAIRLSLSEGVVFPHGNSAISVFRSTLAASIRNIEAHPRGRMFQQFLRNGPYECEGDIPVELQGQRITAKETASVITFIYSFMVNSFKGAITELLASAAVVRLIKQLQQSGLLPPNSRVYVGDAVMVRRKSGKGLLKGADLHVLVLDRDHPAGPGLAVIGLAEVKSGPKSAMSMAQQLDKHILRSKLGLQVASEEYSGERICLGYGPDDRVIRITIQPSNWKLPRSFHNEATDRGRIICLDPTVPPQDEDEIMRKCDDKWHVSLKWSQEAIAEAAYEMTFWYMEKIGEIVFSGYRPKGWEEMNTAEAGRNAVKTMLYYAIRPYAIKDADQSLSKDESLIMQKAVALYNSYGFGYALGMNFRNAEGRREMLWPEDLDEILSHGKTRHECRIS